VLPFPESPNRLAPGRQSRLSLERQSRLSLEKTEPTVAGKTEPAGRWKGPSRLSLEKTEPSKPQVGPPAKQVVETVAVKSRQRKPAVVAAAQPQISPPDGPRSAPPVMTAANGPMIPLPSTAPRGQSGDANRFQDCPTCPRMVPHPGGRVQDGPGIT